MVEAKKLAEPSKLIVGQDDWHTFKALDFKRVEVPPIFFTDGSNGVNPSSHHRTPITETTAFPVGFNMAATWNVEAIEEEGLGIGEEVRAIGANVVLGPCLDISRHPLSGQNWQGFSEDPKLTGRIAAAYVKGVHRAGVGACVKHFACYNQESLRYEYNAIVSERTLREIYLAGFEEAIIQAQPECVMSSYNRVNGMHNSMNSHLLTDILRTEWQFKGLVVTDWGGCPDFGLAMKAGLSLKMPGPWRPKEQDSLKQIPAAVVNRAVAEIASVARRISPCSSTPPPASVRSSSTLR